MPDLVVVIGAGPGLGRAIGAAFVADGADVVLLARHEQRLRALADEIDAAGYLSVDVAHEVALRNAFGDIRERYGNPDVLVHNPSIAYEAPPTRTPPAALLDGITLAAGSLLVALAEVVPAMRAKRRGTILVTGSGAALTGSTWSASLAAQKSAVRNLALSAADELEPHGIRVATITIHGVLGTPGFAVDDIAAEYVRLHRLSTASASPDEKAGEADVWHSEITWPRD